jgi:hypothetical protein
MTKQSRQILIGDKFNEWTVISLPFKKSDINGSTIRIYHLCKCKCGVEKEIDRYHLIHGRSRMCRKCSARLAGMFRQNDNAKHWLYSKWQGIKTRCYNPNQKHTWKYYGAIGIEMHEPWINNFPMFALYIEKVLGFPLSPIYTLDRIDPEGDYAPCNLRWATPYEQKMNSRKRKNYKAYYDGKIKRQERDNYIMENLYSGKFFK